MCAADAETSDYRPDKPEPGEEELSPDDALHDMSADASYWLGRNCALTALLGSETQRSSKR